MLGRGVNSYLLRRGPSYPWGDTLPVLKSADFTIVNLESVIARDGQPWARWPKVFHFRADPVAITSLEMAGIDCVALANNHVLDFEEEALKEMLSLLDKSGIRHAGAGLNLDDARRPVLLQNEKLKLAVVAFTDNEPGWAATAKKIGINYLEISTTEESLNLVRQSINQSRTSGADLVMFTVHWGPNMVERPSLLFQQFAHAVIDAGVDIFHGHSSHIFQGIEIYKSKTIIYDAGDFVDDYAVDPTLRNDRGLMYRLSVADKKVKEIELLPVFISRCQVNLAIAAQREKIVERISALSAEMGTDVRSTDRQLWIDVQ
jgi:poly-gamma-glutamate synthesis protein (capsule biosynthesis protein)